MKTFESRLAGNSYPGRGIVIGMTPDGRNIVQIYWIMGRSENSRNRVFEYNGITLRTRAFEESKLTDPSLVIYNAMRVCNDMHIVTNGDQTDTVYDFVQAGEGFKEALDTREFEPDEPNYTPRISGIVFSNTMVYKLSVLKTINNDKSRGQRNYFEYTKFINGIGHCVTTYIGDGNPLPSFEGEPYPVEILDDIDENTNRFWNMLDEDNRVSLAVKYIDVSSKEITVRIVNKNKEA
ncbi:MAG: IMP cyclohydrolase [Clostridia bacterium]|nr:IMP cyclohydrolase [Clostridia bacterium]